MQNGIEAKNIHAKRPLRVLVATPLGRGGRGGIDRLMDGLRVIYEQQPDPNLNLTFKASRGPGHIALSPLFLGRFLFTLLGSLVGLGPDVLHVNLSVDGSTRRKIQICRLAYALGIPYVLHLHGSSYREYWDAASPALAQQIATMYARSTRTMVLGKVWYDYVLNKVPSMGERLVIFPNATEAVSVVPDKATDGPITILFLGEVGPRKGVPQLVEALAQLPKDGSWNAIIAGNGDVEGTRATVTSLGLKDYVTVPGWVGPDQVRALLKSAHVLCLPSLAENLPMSVIEGMSYGLAVVTTPVGAVEDIIQDEETGLLVPPGISGPLAVALGRLVADSSLRLRLGAAAAQFHQKHLEMGGYYRRLVDLWRSCAK